MARPYNATRLTLDERASTEGRLQAAVTAWLDAGPNDYGTKRTRRNLADKMGVAYGLLCRTLTPGTVRVSDATLIEMHRQVTALTAE